MTPSLAAIICELAAAALDNEDIYCWRPLAQCTTLAIQSKPHNKATLYRRRETDLLDVLAAFISDNHVEEMSHSMVEKNCGFYLKWRYWNIHQFYSDTEQMRFYFISGHSIQMYPTILKRNISRGKNWKYYKSKQTM